MALAPDDPKPARITIREAYTKIREWYQTNTVRFIGSPPEIVRVGYFTIARDYSSAAEASLDLVENLPEEKDLTDVEIKAVLVEVIIGKLECAYHQSDGNYKMAAYAHAALEQAGLHHYLWNEEKKQLKVMGSKLYPYFSSHVIGR